jgi:CRISPR-associated protein Csm5
MGTMRGFMNFLQHYTLKYTPLSPIHIGTGDSYEPTNYVIDGGTLYEFDTGGAVAALSERDRSELSKIVAGRGNEQMLKAVQKFFYDRRDALKPWAVNAIPVLDGVASYYGERVGQIVHKEGNGKGKINKLEIDRTAYNPINRQPVLFGSSVKGAIRTALLDQINNKRSLQTVEDRKTGKKRKENNQELQQRLFQFRAGKFELDPLRLVQISDGIWNQQDALPTSEVLLSVNRKKELKRDKNGNEILSQAEKKENLVKLLECVPAWRYRAFSGQLCLQQIHQLPPSTAAKMPKDNLRFTIQQIAQSCSAFYYPILKSEMDILHERGFINPEWETNIKALLSGMKNKLMSGEVFLLRVGRHSGGEAVTLNQVRNIKILEDKDSQTGKQNYSYADKTKTLWLAASHKDQRANLLPFGWLLVEILQDVEAGQPWPELEAICAGQHRQAEQWAERFANEKARFAERRQADEQRRKQEEQKRRQREEHARQEEQDRLKQEAKAEQERQADEKRLAELPPVEREMAELLKAKTDPNKKDYLVFLEAVKTGRWQEPERLTVLQKIQMLMQEKGDWRPTTQKKDPGKDKEHQRTLEVQKLIG